MTDQYRKMGEGEVLVKVLAAGICTYQSFSD